MKHQIFFNFGVCICLLTKIGKHLTSLTCSTKFIFDFKEIWFNKLFIKLLSSNNFLFEISLSINSFLIIEMKLNSTISIVSLKIV